MSSKLQKSVQNVLNKESLISELDDNERQKDLEISDLREQVANLRELVETMNGTYYSNSQCSIRTAKADTLHSSGLPASHVLEMIRQELQLEFQPRLNTASYVNVVFEPEEEEIALLGLKVNIADSAVYPESFGLHNSILNIIGSLWNCPKSGSYHEYGCYAGAGTVGSTEACLLAGLAFKFRWRKWYANKNELTDEQIRGIQPNLVISDAYQACWEKFFRYFDIEPKFVSPSVNTLTITGEAIRSLVDDKTIGVVCIMGNHYGGQYDPVWEIDEILTEINHKNNWQIGIHIDGASGGFTAPFQDNVKPWDFRLPNVLSISASGHKFGQSCCGTGWIIWRQRENLSEHIAISVSYLGGKADSYTLNFSRPASGIYMQMYKFLRLGFSGYKQMTCNMMTVASFIRHGMREMMYNGQSRFIIMDHGDTECLPVVAARLNPVLELEYDDIDLQHAISEYHWYVCGYKMSYKHPVTEEILPLFSDAPAEGTMLRIVVKSNLTITLAENLLKSISGALDKMDSIGAGYAQLHGSKILKHKENLQKHFTTC